LRIVDLAQMQHMLLDDTAARDAFVLDNAPIAMLLAVLVANLVAQKHGGEALFTDCDARKYPWSAPQPFLPVSTNLDQAISIGCEAHKTPK
jgi:hypothetical protein